MGVKAVTIQRQDPGHDVNTHAIAVRKDLGDRGLVRRHSYRLFPGPLKVGGLPRPGPAAL